MGVSTNGIISFGVVCEEGTEFPWDDEIFNGDIEDWWRNETGFFSTIDSPYDRDGNYAPGYKNGDPRINKYHTAQRKWDEKHSLPVRLENYCSGECPMYAITLPDKSLECRRGHPESFDPEKLTVTNAEIATLYDFLSKYDISYEGSPGWLLMSYWG